MKLAINCTLCVLFQRKSSINATIVWNSQ